MKVAVFIPTYNAVNCCGEIFAATLSTLRQADICRVLVIDSSSTDSTRDLVSQYGFESIRIAKSEFDHGGTRQMALENLSDSDIIVYLTQDVLIKNVESIYKLIQPLSEYPSVIAASYGRQIAHSDADTFARHLRLFNYTRGSYVRGYQDRFVWGMDCVFASDSYSAYNTKILQEVGGFPQRVIFGEDVYTFAKLLKAGYKVSYVADAICKHSHNYHISEDFRRYFDIGVFHTTESWILNQFGHLKDRGIRYAISELQFVIKNDPLLFAKSVLKILAKYTGYKFGLNYHYLSKNICRRLSMNPSFWTS